MRLRKRFFALMAALIMTTSSPIFAASTNGVNKIITVKKGVELEKLLAPELKIELKDTLKKNQVFYLNLENAEWAKDIVKQLGVDPNFTFTLDSKTKLAVEAKQDIEASQVAYKFPLIAKLTGGEAKVEIDSKDTVVTGGKYTFAISNDTKSNITVDDIKAFAQIGETGKVTIEEQYIGAFKSNKPQKITIQLKTKGIEFNYDKDAVIKDGFIGKKSYLGKKYNVKVLDKTTLEVEIPANSLSSTQRGAFELTGIQVKPTSSATYGDVKISIDGDLSESTDVIVARYSDYGVEIKANKEYTVVAGQKLENIEFTLSEIVANSLKENRETIFEFPEEVTINNVVISKSEGIKTGKEAPIITIEQKDNQNSNVFTMKSVVGDRDEKISITFKATLEVPATFTKNINLIVDGTSIEREKQVLIAKVKAPVELGVESAKVKVGLANQLGGKITIKETAGGNISRGKLFLALEESTMKYTKAPEVKVVAGDLRVEDIEIVEGGFEITIKGESTQASTLEISGGEIKVDGTVPDGAFKVKVGGPALSVHSAATLWNPAKQEHNNIDPVIEADFIIVGEFNLADVEKSKNTASFKIGQAKYTVNNVEKTMDTVAYLSEEGRTMLPVRYVADALGVNSNQILWDGGSKTVTIIADKVVQIKLGNAEMRIDGAKVPMTGAAQMQNGRVFVPVAEIARALGAGVDWNSVMQTATFK